MRVVHIEAGRHLYGGAMQVRYLIGGLGAAGVDNVLICAEQSAIAAELTGAERLTAARELALRPRGLVTLPMSGDFDVKLIGKLRRTLRALEPDLVHVHSRRGADLYGGIACALDRLPAVVTRRVDSLEPGLWLRMKYRPYRAVIAISQAIERQLREHARVAPSRIHFVPSAVDAERFKPDPAARRRLIDALELPRDGCLIGVVAQLIARKGHDTLLAALPDLVRRYPTLHVVCFGDGPMRSTLATQVAAAGLGRRVRLTGFRRDLAALLPGLDVVVHPAEREGLGVAVLEAMSAAVPVVACAAGGVVDSIEHDVTGLLVPARDSKRLALALERLIVDPTERRRLGAAARVRVKQRFSVPAMVSAHLDLYEQVRKRDPRRRSASTGVDAGANGAFDTRAHGQHGHTV